MSVSLLLIDRSRVARLWDIPLLQICVSWAGESAAGVSGFRPTTAGFSERVTHGVYSVNAPLPGTTHPHICHLLLINQWEVSKHSALSVSVWKEARRPLTLQMFGRPEWADGQQTGCSLVYHQAQRVTERLARGTTCFCCYFSNVQYPVLHLAYDEAF